MGSLLVGHVAIGLGFLLIGLWHLFNHIKLHSLNPKAYTSHPWFPSPIFKYLEPTLIIITTTVYIAMELFISPSHHQPLDDDWTIPSYHLHNFEHSSISISFLIYALFTIVFDRIHINKRKVLHGLTQLMAAVVFFQEWLLMHLHSTDHDGLEGHYHWLLQIVIVTSFVTTILGVWRNKSFLVKFVRSVSIVLQGVWFVVMGFALWAPGMTAKGCSMKLEDGRHSVRCRAHGSLERAKALANLEFCCLLNGVVVFCVVFYLVLGRWYGEECEYVCLDKEEEDGDECEEFVYLEEGMKLKNLKS